MPSCILAIGLPLDIFFKFIKTIFVIKLIVLSRFFAYLLSVYCVIILLAWMLYLFNLYLSIAVVGIVSNTMKLPRIENIALACTIKTAITFFTH